MNHLLGDRYRLGERIAGGGMGSVYRAVDENLGRQVAVKVLRRDLADDPAFLERFRREARSVAALSHPGVAGVYDYGELGGSAFIVMELVEGETLAERIEATGRLPWREAFALGEGVARALAAAHAHGLVHRDVKPANVLVGRGGRAKHPDDRFPSTTSMADALATLSRAPEQGARHPHPPDAGAPEREGSPTARGMRSAVHSPRGPGRRTLAGAVLVAIALLLLAWLPRSGRPDPPAGQSERPPPASPTTVPGDD
jgi:serine/threonine protein kinase